MLLLTLKLDKLIIHSQYVHFMQGGLSGLLTLQ